LGINVIFEYTNLKTLDSILFYIIIAGLNLLIYGFANNNIASSANKNSSIAFWLGLIGPIGTIICLFQYIKPSWKKVFFGFGRFCFWAIGMQILGEIGIVEEDNKGLLLLFIGFPFILRGKNMFNYSIKKQLDINKNIEPIKSGKNIIDINLKNEAITYLKKGNEEFKNGNYKTAVKYYTKSIETFTNLKEAYKNRSLALKKLNLTEKANKDYKKFLELSKKESSFLKRDSKKEKRTFSIMNIIGPLVCFSLIAALSYFTDISRAYFYLGILLVLIWAVFFSNDKDS
jgi:tetratricopeptide (TPR) repeat protein